jgi:general secretion pathway protein N
MSKGRMLIGAAVAACGLVAVVAGVALAASDPRGLDFRDDNSDRPTSLMLGPDTAAPISTTQPPLQGNPLWGIPLDSLRATRERPLFSPSRRPPAPAVVPPKVEPVKEVVAPPPEPETPQLDLVGVVTGAADGYAIFMTTATHDIVRLKTGEGHDGWVLQSVSGREAVLEKGDRSVVVALPQLTGDQK